MTGVVGYLEKYSVAPAPSRDYYGIRILPNEVIVYLWKISHGPHKTPIVRKVNFAEFTIDKSLQDEINQVFGLSLLKFVREVADNKTDCWSQNSCELDPGWARVLMEGKSMGKSDAKRGFSLYDKKRGTRGNSNSTGHKGNITTRARSRVLAKTPLDIVKTNPAQKKTADKRTEVETTSSIAREISSRGVNDVCTKISKMNFEKSKPLGNETCRSAKSRATDLSSILARRKTTNRKESKTIEFENTRKNQKSSPTVRIKNSKITESTKKSRNSSKSNVFETDKALTKGFANFQKEDTNLDALIRRHATRVSNASSFKSPSYFNCLDHLQSSAGGDSKKSVKSPSSNYEIENPWSSDSSIASVNSCKNDFAIKTSSKTNDVAYLMNKYKIAREHLDKLSTSKGEKMPEKRESRTAENVGKNSEKSSFSKPGVSSRFPKTMISDIRTLDAAESLSTLNARKNKYLEQSNLKTSLIRKTSSSSSKLVDFSRKPRLESKTKSQLKKSSIN